MNRLPTKILKFKTPLDVFSTQTKLPPSLTLDPKVFGCTVFVHIPKQNRNKFSPCSIKCIFLGYGKNQKGYRCYDPETGRMHVTMNCDFIEDRYFYPQLGSQGENTNDSPSWIPTPSGSTFSQPVSHEGPTDDVNNTAGPPTNSTIQSEEFRDNTQSSISPVIPEVCESTHDSTYLHDTNPNRQESEEEEEHKDHPTEESGADRDTEHYELPPRNTRGIPPKWYAPEWK